MPLQTMSQQTVRRIIAVPFILVLLTLAAGAQQAAIGFCALNKTLDFKTDKARDKIALHLTRDLPREDLHELRFKNALLLDWRSATGDFTLFGMKMFPTSSSILGLQSASNTDAFHLFKNSDAWSMTSRYEKNVLPISFGIKVITNQVDAFQDL